MENDGDRSRTVLPQVTAPWRFSIWAGAAKAVARRPRVAMREVYMSGFDGKGESECGFMLYEGEGVNER